jgi:UDP-N-acetylmuramate dehydrogenase
MLRQHNYSLKNNNTFGIDCRAAEFIEYDSVEDLQRVIPELKGRRVLHIGGGSNLLFTGDFPGVVLHSRIKGIDILDETDETVVIRVGAAEVWDDLVAYAVKNGWNGIENLSLIPGETGAAAVQNIGAYGTEVKDVILSVETLSLENGKMRTFSNAECGYAYRQSVFKKSLKGQYAVISVTMRLSKQFSPNVGYGNIRQALEGRELTASNVRQAIIDIRNQKLPDPKVTGNAGSFFVNPVVDADKFNDLRQQYPDMPYYEVEGGFKIPAGWLIEQAGWKGRALGRAAVHDRQALVIVNLGGASAAEIVRLSERVRKDVFSKFGVSISPEVNFV